MDNATRAKLKGLFYAGYKVLACIPAAWLLLFFGLILRIKLIYPTYAFNVDPDYLGMSFHRALIYMGFLVAFLSIPATFLLTLTLLPKNRWFALRWYILLFLISSCCCWYWVFIDPFGLMTWFLD